MSIKSEVTINTPVPEKPYYPRVMVNIREGQEGCKGVVVLFTDAGSGIVIESGNHSDSCPIGQQSNSWVECTDRTHWQPCTITLTTET